MSKYLRVGVGGHNNFVNHFFLKREFNLFFSVSVLFCLLLWTSWFLNCSLLEVALIRTLIALSSFFAIL